MATTKLRMEYQAFGDPDDLMRQEARDELCDWRLEMPRSMYAALCVKIKVRQPGHIQASSVERDSTDSTVVEGDVEEGHIHFIEVEYV